MIVVYRKQVVGNLNIKPRAGKHFMVPIANENKDHPGTPIFKNIYYNYCLHNGDFGVYVHTKKKLNYLKQLPEWVLL